MRSNLGRVCIALLLSIGLLGVLRADDDKKRNKGGSSKPPKPSSSKPPKSTSKPPKSSDKPSSSKPPSTSSGGSGRSGGGMKPGRESDGDHHGGSGGMRPGLEHPPRGGFIPPIVITPGRPVAPPPRTVDIPRSSPPPVVAQPQPGPGQGGGPEIPTPPGYLSRSISRIALGVRYGVYFKPDGGQAQATLPRWWIGSMQDAATVPPKPGEGLPPDAPRSIDVAFVVDTTGSMGDEIRELQNSLDEIVNDFRGPDDSIDVHFGLVAFRDQGDEYVTRLYPFTDDVEKFRETLGALRARGGGDIPERGDQALFETMVKLNWRAPRPDRARVVILCGDAAAQAVPANIQHGDWTYATSLDWLLTTATSNHMQIHTVACSGITPDGLNWFHALAEGSGGTFEDLAGSSRLREELRRRHNLYQKPITPDDLAAAQNLLPPGVRRVAVVPFKNVNDEKKIQFLADLLTDGVSGALKQQPQIAMSSHSAVIGLIRSREFRDKSLADAAVAQALAQRLGVDLILTGYYFNFQDKLHLSGQAIEAKSGQPIVKVEQIVEANSNMFQVPPALAREMLLKAGISVEPVDSASAEPAPERSPAATSYFKKAQELAEQAMRYHARESIGTPLKEKALGYVDRAIRHDSEYLDAYLLKVGLLESIERSSDVVEVLTVAVERARSPQIPPDDPVRQAIEARHAYIVRHDYGTAIQMYNAIIEKQPTNKHALWQLANLMAGEWGCPADLRNFSIARQCVAKILSLYPTSGYARYLEDAAVTLVADPMPAT